MNPRSLIQHRFTCQYYFLFDFFICFHFFALTLFYVPCPCAYCMFSAMAVLSPPPASWVCLFSHRELLYLCVLFFIFLYGYLLHYVVYNTVVCINTIIYFSMGQKKNQWQITTSLEKSDSGILKYVFGTNEVMFFLGKKRNSHPASLKIGTCDLCIHSHVSLVFFPLSNMKLLNF